MPTSPPHSPAPSGIVRPSTRSGSRMSMSGGSRQFAPGILNGSGRAPSRASGEDDEGLRTAVRVAVRIRPPLRPSDPGYDLIPQRFQRSMVQTTSETSLAIDSPQGRKLFVFDRIFGPDVQQEGVWDYLQDSITAFVQGYNVSILAYGQSGAGKSYTMGTSDPNEQNSHDASGVIPRAALALFEKLSPVTRNQTSGIKTPSRYSTPLPTLQKPSASQERPWSMKATYVEIYNEQLRDLLLADNTAFADRRQVNIREDTKGRILLTGLQEMQIESVDDLLAALKFGSSIRQTDSTAINAKSSRSHAVFSINLVQRKPRSALGRDVKEKRYSAPVDILAAGADGFITVDSKLHFVDLAGSERLKNTGAHGDRAREGISINAGLASLGKVISQLSSRQAGSHVSYRDSKLTRLLQDSLGGNAFTYMVACVNPAEFHLSETLNTVQYAQRARAIQSKPQIQEVLVDGDLKALVDRLRAEIAFLRDQVRNADTTSNRSNRHSVDRSTEKEVELQNQLLDIQENYSALSQRHAKLISEITKARDNDATSSTRPTDVVQDRLARSNSFAEAVEQVVLEYEKTIQSLEASLSSTRSNLSATESSLLEKESKLVYLETINSQLQSRVQKLTDRESSTEVYLSDLENKLNGHAFGEERSSAAISELRKELSRVRENEASCEDYISTLEERLAEADQSMEIMQRELERLEHVVERQRSLGKLDNLLHELDTLTHVPSQSGLTAEEKSGPNSAVVDVSEVLEKEQYVEDGEQKAAPMQSDPMSNTVKNGTTVSDDDIMVPSKNENTTLSSSKGQKDEELTSTMEPEFSRTLDRTAQELDHYRKLYHSTMTDYTDMTARYEGALRDLHDLQDQLDEHRHGRSSLIFTTVDEISPPSPQSVSTPVVEQISSSSVGNTDEVVKRQADQNDFGIPDKSSGEIQRSFDDVVRPSSSQNPESNDPTALSAEFDDLEAQYISLQEEHKAVLELVDDLKATISKSRADGVTSPTGAQVLRRKSSQNLMAVDRANRAFKGLKSIAMQYLDGNDDVMDVFDINVNAAMHELQSRSERIHELESEVSGLRKDADAKTAMINGLARERSSITSSPMDISVVSTLQSRLAEREGELQKVHSKLKAREEAFQHEVQSLKNHLVEAQSYRDSRADVDNQTEEKDLGSQTVSENLRPTTPETLSSLDEENLVLQSFLRQEYENLSSIPKNLDLLIDVFDHLIELVTHHRDYKDTLDGPTNSRAYTASWPIIFSKVKDWLSGSKHSAMVQDERLKNYEEEFDTQYSKLASIQKFLKIDGLERDGTDNSTTTFSTLKKVTLWLDILDSSVRTLKTHQEGLHKHNLSVQNELDDEKKQVYGQQTRIAELTEQLTVFQDKLSGKDKDVDDVRAKATILEEKTIELEASNNTLKASLEEIMAKNNELMDEVSLNIKALDAQKALVSELQDLHTLSQKELDDLLKKEASHAGVIDQLEQQLANTYDQHQDAQNRLLQIEEELRASHVDKAQILADHEATTQTSAQELDSLMTELNSLQVKLADAQLELASLPSGVANRTQRSNSVSSTNLRKSASTASLPSPPPVIPLPPLPPSQTPNSNAAVVTASSHPVPPSTPTVSRRPSKDYVATHLEDQEARIKTLEKQLQAEKALTATLEEALTDCEKTMKKLNSDKEIFQRKANQAQQELDRTRNESQSSRYSMQAMEDERLARLKAEKAKEALEERMQALSSKKKSRNFACF